ncbi:MAG: glycoside hydrolase family 32 protein [Erysipelotrichaceae bacterium]|nr:glycoside hydrolase family 32 protein [Erysipelotrichaceae bacterium]
MNNLIKARNYISSQRKNINLENRDHYHFTPKIGWINDPNGLSYFSNYFHMFYQYNPYSTNWDRMHWGHATSKDFVIFKEEKVAIAPSEKYDLGGGIFSGSAIVKDNILQAYYTGVSLNEKQTQNLAFYNGDYFIKYENNPIIDQDLLPKEYDVSNFRDPYVVFKNNKY